MGSPGQVSAKLTRAQRARLWATTEDQTYELKCASPRQVQRSRPNARFKQEMLASMPARKLRSLRYTQRLLTMASMPRWAFLWKATSLTPSALAWGSLTALA